jgi:hypothetical protein
LEGVTLCGIVTTVQYDYASSPPRFLFSRILRIYERIIECGGLFEEAYECEASQTERRGIIVAKFEVLTPWRIFKQEETCPRLPGSKDIFMGPALLV